jgi:UDP-glucose:(heptosyl)LPS alpha-1,3-glucosyltransferase
MRIAFVVHDYHRGGGHSRYVAELASRFSREHEVHVFANRIIDDGTPGIRFHKVPAWRANALTTVLSFALPAWLQVGGGFDIVHSQGFCGFIGNVFTAHMCNAAWYQALRNSQEGATLRESVFSTMASALEHWTYRFAGRSKVIAVSARVGRDLVKYYHCPADIRVIYHGTDTGLFSPRTRQILRPAARQHYGIPDQEFVFLYVGQLRKGARQCIQALAQVPEGLLLCVSPSDPNPYRQFARECGVERRVIFAGHTKEVEKAYAAGDALLLPTPFDTFALVVSEAMACGLPVVVSREAGVSELIDHGVNGLLLDDVTSSAELAAYMLRLSQDAEGTERLSRAGQETIARFTWDEVAERTLEVYETLLEKGQATAVDAA